ncbi:hypothetical protein [Christiangramia echinicola]|uniref:Uncharacterized protein n=1 Tax=Christiangramia echinicola TaxID=279359 RepID=A0A1H1LAQ5_9FLAO|nr:hypothetical protein [Christiangramia echinicola]SDR71392.1 hypothetical protein SAMN04488552_0659 [Christiangramia echinicola]
MKFSKSVLIIFSFFLSISFYGQTNDSLQKVKILNSQLYSSSLYLIDQPFVPKDLNIESDGQKLVLYNATTNLYDVYLDVDDSYSYSSSTSIFRYKPNFITTLFLGSNSVMENNTFLPRTFLLLSEDVSYPVRDSFNPNGASNFSEAVLGGVLGLLFN